jgi:hypothetical protein
MKSLLVLFTALLTPAAVLAQDRPPIVAPGSLVVERIHNTFVVTPDFKITEVDGRTGRLAGVSAGWLQEDTLFVGGAGYWLTNRSDDLELAYGGVTVGWTMPPERRLQVGARALVGLGTATLGTDFDLGMRGGARTFRDGRHTTATSVTSIRTIRVPVREDFLVFEPQVTVGAWLTHRVGVILGAGYRVAGLVDVLDERLNGASGSISLQLKLH